MAVTRGSPFPLALATIAATLAWFGGSPARALAQDTVVVRHDRPPVRASGVEPWAVEVFNARGTHRAFGRLVLGRGEVTRGDVAVVDGPVTVSGTIQGDLIAINADVTLAEGAVVDGDVVVLGGTVDERPGARVGGSLRRHAERVPVRREGDRLVLLADREPRRASRPRRTFYDRDRGEAFVILGIGGTYNRVEGLPLRAGAGVEWEGRGIEGRLRGYGIFRTAGDFKRNRRDLGYAAEGRLRIGDRPNVELVGRAFDEVVPTQDWPLTRHEVGWASLLWQRDYRDYFLQRGLAASVAFEPVRHFTVSAGVARVDETSIAERDPWTLFRNDQRWRPNPSVDQGDFTLLTGTLAYDTRPSERSRRSGSFARVSWERGLGDNVIERPLPTTVRAPLPATDYVFDRVAVDLRRYQRIGWGGQLRLRGFYAGNAGDDPLPIQRRLSLGGPDPLNGYGFRAFACHAAVPDPALPDLCDHVVLVQAEYRGGFGFRVRDSDRRDPPERRRDARWDWDWDFDDRFWFDSPEIVFFSNAGTGWLGSREDVPNLSWDVGVGVEFGGAGLYLAKAIREGEPLRVTFRLERRF